jgi:hypothetical protein
VAVGIGASEAPDNRGNWEYTNGTASGSRAVRNLPPGNYEARAYFHGSTNVEDRWSFVVEK